MRLVLFSVVAPNNLLFFIALVILGVLALPHLDFYQFLFNISFEYICGLAELIYIEPDL